MKGNEDHDSHSPPRTLSVIVPARNEERWLPGCLASIRAAAAVLGRGPEIVVVNNRCTDGTEAIAREAGALIAHDDTKNLSRIRNTGVRASSGDIIVTLDADSRMHPKALRAVEAALSSGRYIGGGTTIRPERLSPGIILSGALILLMCGVPHRRISAGMFWCLRRDFDAIGGFNERLILAEDVDFARRLKAYGKTQGKRFHTLMGTPMVTSCRKFDRFGDWFLFRQPWILWRALRAQDRALADFYFYDYRH